MNCERIELCAQLQFCVECAVDRASWYRHMLRAMHIAHRTTTTTEKRSTVAPQLSVAQCIKCITSDGFQFCGISVLCWMLDAGWSSAARRGAEYQFLRTSFLSSSITCYCSLIGRFFGQRMSRARERTISDTCAHRFFITRTGPLRNLSRSISCASYTAHTRSDQAELWYFLFVILNPFKLI